jgi:acetyltransferase-like isoleucine patch superfamily enzyme
MNILKSIKVIFPKIYNYTLYNILTFLYGFCKGINVHKIGNIKLSKNVVIGDYSVLTTGNMGEIIIENCVSIGMNAWIASGNGKVLIGKECLFGPRVTIVSQNHSTQELNFNNFLPWLRDSDPMTTIIGDRCSIGANVTILPGSYIGNYSNIAANSVVKGSYPPGSLIGGIPAKILKRYVIPHDLDNHLFYGKPPYRHTSIKFY